jgi:serine/threonine protein kinase
VRWLSDAVLAHLCQVADWPDLSGTRYELIEKIGQGGMGTVFLATDHQLNRPVALKVLRAASDAAQTRMVQEARILARLEHPSIVPVHDAGTLNDGRFYYAMKLVRGKRLDEQLQQPMALAERLQLFHKICDAVAFAHAHGVLHRDLKPQNIMLGAFGEVLVMDWGVAKEMGTSESQPTRDTKAADRVETGQTMHGTILGTPGYMAPEQARGEVALLDARADVYALGAILYFLLTGKVPMYESRPTTSGAAAGATWIPPRRFDRAIPRPLQAICRKALSAAREDRYPSVSELGQDIANFLARRRVQAYPERTLEAVLRLATKYRTPLALILAYLVMRVLLLVLLGH